MYPYIFINSYFRDCKAKGQEIGKLSIQTEKIDCFNINFAPVRTEIEMHNRKLWDSLVSNLHSSINNDVATIEMFTSNAIQTLKQQPHL